MLGFNPRTKQKRRLPTFNNQMKDCAKCRARLWERQARWLWHLWVEDESMYVENGRLHVSYAPGVGFFVVDRPGALWVGSGLPRERWTRCMKDRGRAAGAESFVVFMEDETVTVVADSNLSPRAGLLRLCPPDLALEVLGAAYTSDAVRRHKGRSITDGWQVPSLWKQGPFAGSERLKEAQERSGHEDGPLRDGETEESVSRDVRRELRRKL